MTLNKSEAVEEGRVGLRPLSSLLSVWGATGFHVRFGSASVAPAVARPSWERSFVQGTQAISRA